MKWELAVAEPESTSTLSQQLGISRFLASLLVSRGYDTQASAGTFLGPKLSDFTNPLDLPGIPAAAERLAGAIANREKVLVYGDYDVDGVTSVSLLLTFLRDVGFSASFMLPSRFTDGYGLNQARAEQIAEEGYKLLITVDCGSSSLDELAYLRSKGVDVIVTDHHRVHNERPDVLAFINPDAWEEDHEFKVLAGVGVAFLLVMATHIKLRDTDRYGDRLPSLKSYLDIVTVGTVADMVPLTGPNRTLVVHGLDCLRKSSVRPGVVALKEVCKIGDREMDTTSIAFYMAPRINAAGRLGNAEVGVELLLSPSYHKAIRLARKLDDDNQRRRDLEAGIFEEADRLVAAANDHGRVPNAIVLGSPDWHKGVLGIVASRICEKYHRPTLLMAIEDGIATGSGRSVAGLDLSSALEQLSSLLVRFGGHSMAAGLTMEVEKLDSLREGLEKHVGELLDPDAMEPTLQIDYDVPLAEVGRDMILDLEKFSPFGSGNPEPAIAVRGVTVKSKQIVGGDHLKLFVEQDGRTLEAIGFRMGDLSVEPRDKIDIAFFPEIRTWQGVSYLQLRMKDIRPAAD